MSDYEKKFTVDSSEEDLVSVFNNWLNESQTYHDYLLKNQKFAEQYYNGNQTDRDLVPEHASDTVENRIFEGVETLVPVATANAHQFLVLAPRDEDSSKLKARKLQTILEKKYETLEVQRKLEDVTRHLLLYRFGVLKYFWNDEINDVDVKSIDPRLILVPKLRLDPHELPYVMELQEYTKDEMEENFPDFDLTKLPSPAKNPVNSYGEELYQVYEVWTNEVLAWFC